MLETERNTDDRKAQDGSCCNMEQGDLYTSHKDPYHIHYDREASSVIGIRLNFMTEWPKGEAGHLDKLKAEWYADDCNAEQDSYKKVVQADEQTAKHKPENVS